jgi:Tfp pilus assembly protein PilN
MTMVSEINLLPEAALKAYRKSRRWLIMSRILWGIGSFVLILLIFFVVAWQYLVIVRASEKDRLESVKRAEASRLERATRAETALGDLVKELRVLRDLEKPQYDPSDIVRRIVEVLPKNARLTTITVTLESFEATAKKGETPRQKIFVSGNAATRSDVLAFEHALKALPFAASVESPIENILKPVDTTFSFTIFLKPLASTEAKTETPATSPSERSIVNP